MEKAKTIAVNMAVIAAIAIVLIWGITWYRQWSQFNKGEKAMDAGDYIAAIAGYESAIHMYTPWSPLVERSAERLWGITEGYERNGDPERALIACRSLRSSFYAARGLYTPGKEWIASCDAKIDGLVKLQAQLQRR
ncbi:MAG: hypothetical protein FD174_3443 [Geobacteraceae bacterium]|nr:MAG: hypothetical protein FD174_3443 [Geobacteraceae bacterium]